MHKRALETEQIYISGVLPPPLTQKSSMVSYDEEDEDSDIFGESDRDDDDDDDDNNTGVRLLRLY